MPYHEFYADDEWLEYETIRQEIECGNRDPQDLEDWCDAWEKKQTDVKIRTSIEHIPKSWHAYDWRQSFLWPYDEPDTLCAEFHLAQGRPLGIVGLPGSGKNELAQHIALCVASGRPILERYSVLRRGRVLHITYDMGFWGTAIRYRRLANGMNLLQSDIENNLVILAYPDSHLASPSALADFSAVIRGFDLVILDNARAATPGLDENDSRFGAAIGVFGRACDKNRAIGIYLHHTRKGGEAGIEAVRGSSAIVGASGAIFFVQQTGNPNEPRLVSHVRAHEMFPDTMEPFEVVHAPVAHNGQFDVGAQGLSPIRLSIRDLPDGDGEVKQRGMNLEELECAILSALSQDVWINTQDILDQVGGKAVRVRDMLEHLKASGRVVDDRVDRARMWKKL